MLIVTSFSTFHLRDHLVPMDHEDLLDDPDHPYVLRICLIM
jgi:hypothetical protein